MGRHSVPRPAPARGSQPPHTGLLIGLTVGLVIAVSQLAPGPGAPAADAAPAAVTAVPRSTAPAIGGGAAPIPGVLPATVTIAFAGDVHFTGRTAGLLEDPAGAFGPISDILGAADLTVANLESAITQRGTPAPKQYHFRAPPVALDAMSVAGIDVVSMANNHAVDYGAEGLADSLAAVAAHELPVVGIGPDAASAYAPAYADVRGTRVAVLAASQVPDHTYRAWTATDETPGIATTRDRDRLHAAVAGAAATADIVVVYLHWGVEDDSCPTPGMRELAEDLAAAGADAIIGTHAHVLLGSGYLPDGTFVSYGMGNFLWWRPLAHSDQTGVLTLTFEQGQAAASEFAPALIDAAGRPQPVTGARAAAQLVEYDALRGCAELSAVPGGLSAPRPVG
ncbi:hypothetical protein BH20ACT5_BH20ACT5_13200 [soil metagenome]